MPSKETGLDDSFFFFLEGWVNRSGTEAQQLAAE